MVQFLNANRVFNVEQAEDFGMYIGTLNFAFQLNQCFSKVMLILWGQHYLSNNQEARHPSQKLRLATRIERHQWELLEQNIVHYNLCTLLSSGGYKSNFKCLIKSDFLLSTCISPPCPEQICNHCTALVRCKLFFL